MGLRGPNSMAWRLRQRQPTPTAPPSPAEVRRAKAIERLNNLAWGSGLKIEEARHGRFAIVGKLERIEAIIERERS